MGRSSSSTRNLPFKSLFKPRNPKQSPSSSSSSSPSSSSSFSSNSFLSPSPWAWPSCKQPKTLSFRLVNEEKDDNGDHLAYLDSTDSRFTTSSTSFDIFSESFSASDCSVEAAIQAVSSNRLLFDGLSGRSSSIAEKCFGDDKDVGVGVPFEGSIAVEVESENLYRDFLASMKEMAEATTGEVKKKGLAWFEEMLEWYLRVNKKWTHEFIVGAYWDLLSEMMGSSTTSSSCSNDTTSGLLPSSSSSSSSSSYVSCLSEINEVKERNR